MGNQSSSANDGIGIGRGNPFRKSGRLGLSREELDNRCKPSGLYESCSWDDKGIRRLIGDGKFAARLHGTDNRQTGTDRECPICFLHYSGINMLTCCKATICTECFLQVQNSRGTNPCPFCNKAKMTVKIAKCLDDEEIMKRDADEQKMIEASIKAKFGGGEVTQGTAAATPTGANNETQEDTSEKSRATSFGKNLDADLQSRSRSRTLSSSSGIIAMSPDERKALEEEMRSQRYHPLVRQMSLDADRERQRHESEYRETTRDRNRDTQRRIEELLSRRATAIAGDRERRDFNERLSIVTGIHDSDDEESEVNERLDDLFMIEAALYLSIRDGSSRINSNRNRGSRSSSRSGSETGNNTNNSGDGRNRDRSHRGSRLLRRENYSSGRSNRSRDRDRSRNAIDPENIVQALLRERGVEERPNNPIIGERDFDEYPSPRDALLMEMSEASQLEMAIQLSLEEAHQRGGEDGQDTSNVSDQDAEEDAEEVDHGEEEIVFEHTDEADNPSENNENANVRVLEQTVEADGSIENNENTE